LGTLSISSRAGPDRFWARSAQKQERESKPKFCTANFRSAKFHEICAQDVDLCRHESFQRTFLEFARKGSFFQKANFSGKIFNDFGLQAAISVKGLQIAESHNALANLRNVGFPLLPLESTLSDSRGLYSMHMESTLSPKHSSMASCTHCKSATYLALKLHYC